MRKRQTLSEWIHEAMIDPDKGGRCVALSLVLKVGIQDQEIHSCKFGGRAFESKQLAEMFQNKAEAYAQDLPGAQTFNILAFYEGENEPQARHPFVIQPQNEFNGLTTEGPDERGMRQQGMRLTEAIVHNTFRMQSMLFQVCQNTIEAQDRRINHLSHENQEMFNILREEMLNRINREHERSMQIAQYERETAERKKWLGLIPPLTNTVMGREIFPQNTADTSMLEAIAESLASKTPEEAGAAAGALANVIPPELVGPILKRLNEIAEAKKKEKALIAMKAQAMVNSASINGTPAKDAS